MQERPENAPQELKSINDFLESNRGFSDHADLTCISCGNHFPSKPDAIYNCLGCNDILDVNYDFGEGIKPADLKALWKLRRTSNLPEDASGVWRFRDLMPFVEDPNQVVTLGEGNTPLLRVEECSKYTGAENLYVKHQGFNPTGSFKDPGMSAAITQAKILEMKAVACASTGNTSASMAAYARRAGMLPIVFVPEGQIAYGKLSQALDFGALTVQIQGDFDKAMELVMEVAPETGVYVVNSINPFRIEGQKTMVLEMLEQMDWQVPDRIVVPGGNLGHASSIWKALRELRGLGFIDKYPRLTVVQAEGADPLYQTVTSDDHDHLVAVHAKTLATAIKIGNPISWKKTMRGLEATDGWVTEVSEQEIADAKAVIGSDGIGCEPASAVTIAGLKKLIRQGTDKPFDRQETVVAILTGHMLKDPDYPVLYHKDNLHEEFETRTEIVPRGSKIQSNFGNMPVQIGPDADKLRQIIFERMENSVRS